MTENNNEQNNKRKVGRPARYVLWKDWERWLLLEWHPKMNDLAHLRSDMAWLKILTVGILLAIIGCALAVILSK